jgi:CBS domain-containing protein
MSEIESRVSDILENKGNNVLSIDSQATVYDSVVKMSDKSVGSLVVMAGDNILGIITERDYLRKVIVKGKSSKETKVTEVMSKDLICISPDYTVKEALAVMTEKHIRHLPIMDGAKLAGLVSVGDLIKMASKDQQVTIKYMKDYIEARYPA